MLFIFDSKKKSRFDNNFFLFKKTIIILINFEKIICFFFHLNDSSNTHIISRRKLHKYKNISTFYENYVFFEKINNYFFRIKNIHFN